MLGRRESRGGGVQGVHTPPPIFGLAVPNLSPTLHARTPDDTPCAPPHFQILDLPLLGMLYVHQCGATAHHN